MILIVLLLVSVFIISAKSFYHHHHSSQSYDLLKSRPLRRSSGSSITMNGIDDSSNAAKRGNRNKSTALWSRWSSISIKNDDKSTTSAKKKSPSPPPSLLPSSASSLPSSPLDVKNILRNFFSDGDGFTKIENDIIGIQLGLGLVLFLGGALFIDNQNNMTAMRKERREDMMMMREERKQDKAEMREDRKQDKAEMREERKEDKAEMEQKYEITTLISTLALVVPIVTKSSNK